MSTDSSLNIFILYFPDITFAQILLEVKREKVFLKVSLTL